MSVVEIETRHVDGVQSPDGAVGALLASGDGVDILYKLAGPV